MQVLDGGRIHEYDEPHVLLQNKDGIFYKMVHQTGKAEAASLIQLAKEVLYRKQSTNINTYSNIHFFTNVPIFIHSIFINLLF